MNAEITGTVIGQMIKDIEHNLLVIEYEEDRILSESLLDPIGINQLDLLLLERASLNSMLMGLKKDE